MTDTPKASPALPAALRYLLFASVALNLFLAGLWAGTIGQHFFNPSAAPPGHFGVRIGRVLDEADKTKVARNLVQLDTYVTQSRADMEGTRDKIVAAMGATVFDPDAFAAALAVFHDQESRMHANIDKQLAAILSELPQHGRALLGQEMFARRPPFAPPPSQD